MLQLDWEAEGMVEALGAKLGQDDRKVKSDLERFKELIEAARQRVRRLARRGRSEDRLEVVREREAEAEGSVVACEIRCLGFELVHAVGK